MSVSLVEKMRLARCDACGRIVWDHTPPEANACTATLKKITDALFPVSETHRTTEGE